MAAANTSNETDFPSLFSYDLLTEPGKQIRLLELHYDAQSEHMACTLTTYYLEETPEYTAISYTWGDAVSTSVVTLNGHAAKVRCNCCYALWQAWLHHKTTDYWIDSICINQTNVHEKGHQVAMMADIYERAELVLACVGPSADDSDFVMDNLGRLGAYTTDQPSVADGGVNHEASLAESLSPEVDRWVNSLDGDFFKRLAVAIAHLSDRPYFSRLWIMQEVFVARCISFCCGTKIADPQAFQFLINAANPATESDALPNTLMSLVMGDFGTGRDLLEGTFILGLVSGILDLADQQPSDPRAMTGFDVFRNCLPFIRSNDDKKKEDSRVPIDEMQHRATKFQCQDPRDVVFGTLRLVDWGTAAPITPDYTISRFDLAMKTLRAVHDSGLAKRSCTMLATNLARNLHLDLDDSQVRGFIHDSEALPANRINSDTKDSPLLLREQHLTEIATGCRLLRTKSGRLTAPLYNDNTTTDGTLEMVHPVRFQILEAWDRLDDNDLKCNSQPITVKGQLLAVVCAEAQPGDYLVAAEADVDFSLLLVLRKGNAGKYSIIGPAIQRPTVRLCTSSEYCHCAIGEKAHIHGDLTFAMHFQLEDLLVLGVQMATLSNPSTYSEDQILSRLQTRMCSSVMSSYATLDTRTRFETSCFRARVDTKQGNGPRFGAVAGLKKEGLSSRWRSGLRNFLSMRFSGQVVADDSSIETDSLSDGDHIDRASQIVP